MFHKIVMNNSVFFFVHIFSKKHKLLDKNSLHNKKPEENQQMHGQLTFF